MPTPDIHVMTVTAQLAAQITTVKVKMTVLADDASSFVGAVGFQKPLGLVMMLSGKLYVFPTAPKRLMKELLAAESKGRFFQKNIKQAHASISAS